MVKTADAQTHDLTIDREFQSLLVPLTPEERSILEASLERDGCRDAIVTWANHDDTIIDGHNRYEICRQLGIPFKTKAITLPDREAVVNWIIDNQLGRRNLTDEKRSYYRGKRYQAEKKAHGGDRKSEESSGQNVHLNTAARIAEANGVDEKTIRRDAQYAEAVDTLAANVGPQVRADILNGESPLSKKDVVAIAALPAKEQRKAVQQAEAPDDEPEESDADDDDFGASLFRAAHEARRELSRAIKAILDSRFGVFLTRPIILRQCRDIGRMLEEAEPNEECPYCRGKGCVTCGDLGRMPSGVAAQHKE